MVQVRYRLPDMQTAYHDLLNSTTRVQVKQITNLVLGRGKGREETTGATHVFCLGIGFGVHRPFLDGALWRWETC